MLTELTFFLIPLHDWPLFMHSLTIQMLVFCKIKHNDNVHVCAVMCVFHQVVTGGQLQNLLVRESYPAVINAMLARF